MDVMSSNIILEYLIKVEWSESIAFTFEELILEFYPMQSECVQHGLHQVHYHEYGEGHCEENVVSNP